MKKAERGGSVNGIYCGVQTGVQEFLWERAYKSYPVVTQELRFL